MQHIVYEEHRLPKHEMEACRRSEKTLKNWKRTKAH